MLDRKIVIIGYSGHGLVVVEAALLQGLDIKAYIDKDKVIFNPYELDYLGFEKDDHFAFWNNDFSVILGIGDNNIRTQAAEFFYSKNKEILNVIHPSATVSKYLKKGIGNFIAANATVNPFVTIGDYGIINTGAIIEHECIIGNAVHIAPGVVLAGGVKVDDNSFIGANSVIKEGIKIGKNVIVGAGSVILHDVENNAKIVGNPGRKL